MDHALKGAFLSLSLDPPLGLSGGCRSVMRFGRQSPLRGRPAPIRRVPAMKGAFEAWLVS
jgi:hypothetical protein